MTVSAVEDEEFRLYAEKYAEENTIVAKLVTFDAIIHGYYKTQQRKRLTSGWQLTTSARDEDKRIPMLANHNIASVIGSWTNIEKVSGGIMVSGNFSETQYAQEQRQA